MRDWTTNPPTTFEDMAELARESMEVGGREAARIRGEAPPTIREEQTPTGIRLVAVWPDGEETNEATINRLES